MSRWLPVLLLLLFSTNALAAKRVVVLAPAAADILVRLQAQDRVVGVTRSVDAFPAATRVGSHIRPNLEIIRSLRPDLLILSSNRFFSAAMAAAVDAELFYYHPQTLEEVLQQSAALAAVLDRRAAGQTLIEEQRRKLEKIKRLPRAPGVIYEVSAMPLMLAGQKNIVRDIIEQAGGRLLTPGDRKLVRFNAEGILARQPRIYIYQVGPMNRNPTPPAERGPLRSLKATILQVDELQFSRANTGSFDNVLMLNRFFLKTLSDSE